MSKPQSFRPRPDLPDQTLGGTTTRVRAEAHAADGAAELHPQLQAQLRELQLRSASADPDLSMLLRLGN
jgi:hypothetical protein